MDTFLQQLYSTKGEQQILVHSSFKYLSTIILSLINFLSCHLHCLFLYATNKPIQQLFWMLAIHIASTMLSLKVTIMPFPSSHILVIARGFPFPLAVLENESTFQNFSHCLCRMKLQAALPSEALSQTCALLSTSSYWHLTHLPQIVQLYFPLPSASLFLGHLWF